MQGDAEIHILIYPSFSKTACKCLFNRELLSSVRNFAVPIGKPILQVLLSYLSARGESRTMTCAQRKDTKVLWASAQACSHRYVRQCAFVLCLLVLLSACSGKHGPVAVSKPGSPAASSSEFEGLASYYAEPHHGRRTANGEVFNTYQAMTAAHRTLPFNTVVRVKNTINGKAVAVRINDRGPFIAGRIIDVSLRAARALDMERAGVVPVQLEIIRWGG
jgi:rare lipoprotein A